MDLLALKILLGDKGPGDSVTVPAEMLRVLLEEVEPLLEECAELGYGTLADAYKGGRDAGYDDGYDAGYDAGYSEGTAE